jgi:hypothetical protein
MAKKRYKVTVRLGEKEMIFLHSRTVSFSQTLRSALHSYSNIIRYIRKHPYPRNKREWNRTNRIIEQVRLGEPLILVRRKSLNRTDHLGKGRRVSG